MSKRLLLGVSGGIAAYKACDLVSRAVKADWEVEVVMTANAARFVTPLSFAALSGRAVHTDTFAADKPMAHIHLARWATVALVAPLSANTLGKIACGLADDLLTTTLLALPTATPCLLAPAMNTVMWDAPVVQRNIGWIDALGQYRWVAPVSKRLACGDVGMGGLAEVDDLMAAIEAAATAPAPR